jgi:hypothetical protein
MTRDTLSTLDLTEQPGQRIWTIRRVQHHQADGPVELRPGERAFAIGAAHHDCHVVLAEFEEQPAPAIVSGQGGPEGFDR